MMRTEICMVQLLYRKAKEVSREHFVTTTKLCKQKKRKRKKTSGKREEDARTGMKKVGSSSEWGCLIRV
jgi:hypothetical protein